MEALQKMRGKENDYSCDLDKHMNNKVFDTQMVEGILGESS